MIERILVLMENRKISGLKLASELGFNKGNVADWKSGKTKPRTEHIVKLADFFGVTTDYLLTGQEPLPPDVTADEMDILKKLRSLSPEKRKAIEMLLE